MGSQPGQALIPPELAELVARRTGVDLGRGGLDGNFADFVRKRCRARGEAPSKYAQEVLAGDADEERVLLEAISIPHTWFFRDRAQLELALAYAEGTLPVPRSLRIWIPGCATGEDVYGIAILALLRGLEVSVLGTDISNTALEHARRALYDASSFRDFPPEVAVHFREAKGKRSPSPEIRQKASFEWHNLMDPTRSTPGGWDLIVCRNVVIYFSRAAAVACTERLGEALAPRGALVLGAGELAAESPRGLEPTLIGSRVMLLRGKTGSAGRNLQSPAPQNLPLAVASPPRPSAEPLRTPRASPPSARRPDPFRTLLEASDLAAAALELEGMGRKDPTSASVLLCMGIVHFARGDYERALEELARAALRDPRSWPAALYKGLCLERCGQPEYAGEEFRRARDLLGSPTPGTALPVQFATLATELLELALTRRAPEP